MKKIGVTFSAFDLLHPGHIIMLEDCKRVCDYLIVGVQSDPTIDRKNSEDNYSKISGKSKNIPIQTLEERLIMIKSIKFVDEVFVYNTEKDLYNWLNNNKWDIRILGSDWQNKEFTGNDINGELYFHKRDHDWSTTEFRNRLKNS
jgi:glycerol-3-phosphate cytidylyltransferase